MSTEILIPQRPAAHTQNEYLELLKDKKILITGAGGYLGTALLSSLYEVPCEILALVHKQNCIPAPSASAATVTSQRADLSQSSVWLDVLCEIRPDVIVNLAAYEHRRDSPHAPELDLAINTATVLELLEACRKLNLRPRIVQASSANIFGCPAEPLVNEDTPDQPLTLYALNKLAAERYLEYYAATCEIPSVSLRFGNIYGPLRARAPERELRVVLNRMIDRALAGGPLYVYRNQGRVRDFLFVDDAVRAICAAATSETIVRGGKYVAGSGEGYSLRQIASEIARQVENLALPSVAVLSDDEASLAPVEWRDFIADYDRLRAATGWQPQTKLDKGIELTLRAFMRDPGDPEV